VLRTAFSVVGWLRGIRRAFARVIVIESARNAAQPHIIRA
jgi:hypothetical protein